jgi:hypothetical protein
MAGLSGEEIIDAGLRFYLSIGGTAQQDTELRIRCEFHLNNRAPKFYRFRPWWWRYGEGTVVVSDQGYGDLPLDFGSQRGLGAVSHDSQKYPLSWVSPTRLLEARRSTTGRSAHPQVWTLMGDDGEENRRLHVHPMPPTGATVTLRIDYERSTPTIVDSSFPSGMERFPEDYHRTVLWTGLRADLMFDAGDARAAAEERAFLAAMIEAWKEENQAGHAQRQVGDEYGDRVWRS